MAREEWGEWPRRARRRTWRAGYGEELGRWWRRPRWDEEASRAGWEPWSAEERRRLRWRGRRSGARRAEEPPWAPRPEYEERWIPERGYGYPYAARRRYPPYRERRAYGWPYAERWPYARYGVEFAGGYGETFYGERRQRRRARESRGGYGGEYGW